MKRINDDEVELTDAEMAVLEVLDSLIGLALASVDADGTVIGSREQALSTLWPRTAVPAERFLLSPMTNSVMTADFVAYIEGD